MALLRFMGWTVWSMENWWNLKRGARGIALNLERDSVGVVLLGIEAGLHEGSWVKRTGRPAVDPVGEEVLGPDGQRIGGPIDRAWGPSLRWRPVPLSMRPPALSPGSGEPAPANRHSGH